MIAGHRCEYTYFPWVVESAHAKGLIFLSADHRLIHPSTGSDIIADVRALFAFLASPSFSAAHLPLGVELDPERLAVMGISGGGYAARAAALYAEPRPRAAYLLYAMGGDFLSDHWLAVKEPAATLVIGPIDIKPGWDAVKHLLENEPAPATEAPSGRLTLLSWFWRTGTLLDHVLGEPISAGLRALPKDGRLAAVPVRLRPALLLETQSGPGGFPPTFLLHGGADAVVPVAESRATYERLLGAGVEVEIAVIEGAPHGLIAGFAPVRFVEGAEEAHERGMEFVARFLGCPAAGL
ncbi:hypothetical protein FOMPIDRAFT_1047924 [Fomitopsis schrenkii]|uniref:Peptidase S9 prolyl oligopeptidase catalytic domain-containing protein n=1 Tax=Fomitopsis schrenkii TaxID=2126942 RepID=S8ECA8_FOMSC|nr:hypothetical protein FOMPIDRAFT_1047924 [Fomitopsis schrenkii]